MKKKQTSKVIKHLFLIIPILLSACHTAQFNSDLNNTMSSDHIPSLYIDQTNSLFPLYNYSQSVDRWLPPNSSMHTPVIDNVAQQIHFSDLKSRYFDMGVDGKSPWNASYIASVLIKGIETNRDASVKKYLGEESIYWGENFKAHPNNWKKSVRNNAMTRINHVYAPSARGIIIKETLIRAIPTDTSFYDDPNGYPFDNLQMSSVRPGVPVYVLTVSRDKRWKYVLSPSVTGWIHSEDIADVDQHFVTKWLSLANKNLGVFVKEPVSIHEKEVYYFTARIGTILPYKNKQHGFFKVTIPVRNSYDGHAQIKLIRVKDEEFVAMPWKMTPSNMAILMKSRIGKPYGWGNYNFYNDCSAEIRSLMLPFGILLPRNSAEQILSASKIVDLSNEKTDERLRYLSENGKPFTTIIYISGHIMLYIGNTVINGHNIPMTYQNMWGLHSKKSTGRFIIGGAVFFPLLSTYPENSNLISPAGKSTFKLGFIE